MPRLPSASPLRAATTRRHRASSRSSGTSRSAFASNSTSRPTIPQSAIPCSTYTGTSAGFTKMNLYRRRESSTASLRDINASLESAIPARANRASDASCILPLPIAIVNIQGSSFAKQPSLHHPQSLRSTHPDRQRILPLVQLGQMPTSTGRTGRRDPRESLRLRRRS